MFYKTKLGQSRLLDMALQVGLVAKSEKTKPPCQKELYYGGIYDNTTTPMGPYPQQVYFDLQQVSFF